VNTDIEDDEIVDHTNGEHDEFDQSFPLECDLQNHSEREDIFCATWGIRRLCPSDHDQEKRAD